MLKGRKMDERELLALLDNAEVQERIRKIVRTDTVTISSKETVSFGYPETKEIQGDPRAPVRQTGEAQELNQERAPSPQEITSRRVTPPTSQQDALGNRCEGSSNEQENESLQNEIRRLREEQERSSARESQLKEENQRLTQRVKEKGDDLSSKEREFLDLSRKHREAISKLTAIQEEFAIFYRFQSLSPRTREELQEYFKGDTLTSFLACGVQRECFENLWMFVKQRIMDGNTEELEILTELVYYFLDLFNSTYNSPVFELQTVNQNESFDALKHTRTADGSVSGRIETVLLRGYSNVNTGRRIRSSIVKVQG